MLKGLLTVIFFYVMVVICDASSGHGGGVSETRSTYLCLDSAHVRVPHLSSAPHFAAVASYA